MRDLVAEGAGEKAELTTIAGERSERVGAYGKRLCVAVGNGDRIRRKKVRRRDKHEARDGPMLRKLAREATIFALLGMVLAAIGVFVYMDNEDRANAKRQAAIAVHAVEGMYVLTDGGTVKALQVPLTNGTVLRVRWCPIAWDKFGNPGKDERYENCRLFDFMRKREVVLVHDSIQLGSVDQIAIEKDYWTAYKEARRHALGGQVLGSLLLGLLGFPAGLVLWIFYRLVRFAVKG